MQVIVVIVPNKRYEFLNCAYFRISYSFACYQGEGMERLKAKGREGYEKGRSLRKGGV